MCARWVLSTLDLSGALQRGRSAHGADDGVAGHGSRSRPPSRAEGRSRPEGRYRRRRAAPAGNRTGVVCVFGSESNATNVELVRRWSQLGFDTSLMSPSDDPPPGAVVLGRLDVLPTLDGIEPGLRELGDIERQGAAVVLNPAGALISVHDKLVTAR